MRKRSVLMTIDQELVTLVDLIAAAEGTNRSAITREALNEWTDRYNKKTPISKISTKVLKDKKNIQNDVNSSDERPKVIKNDDLK